jgi:thiol-disulfide isomerase/thioredoxin
MRRALAVFLGFAVLGFGALTPVDEDGFQRLVDSHKGKVVLYSFWATWCVPCRAEMPQLVRLEAKLRSQGFELVTISADEPEQDADAERVLKQFAVRGPLYRRQANDDDQFINSIDVKWSGALPALFLYDKTGHKTRSFIGETDIATLESAIRKLFKSTAARRRGIDGAATPEFQGRQLLLDPEGNRGRPPCRGSDAGIGDHPSRSADQSIPRRPGPRTVRDCG